MKTHCKYGHELIESNIYWYNGTRRCKKCSARRQQEIRDKYKKIIEKENIETKTETIQGDGFILIAWSTKKG